MAETGDKQQFDENLRRLIAGAIAEVDPQQIVISRRLTLAQRFQQGYSMTRLAERVATYRRRQRQTQLETGEINHLVRERGTLEK